MNKAAVPTIEMFVPETDRLVIFGLDRMKRDCVFATVSHEEPGT